MRKVEAIIKPFKLDEVKEALNELVSKGLLSVKLRVSAARKDIRNSIAALNMLLILFLK